MTPWHETPVFDALRSETYRATAVDVADLIPCEHETATLADDGDFTCDRCGAILDDDLADLEWPDDDDDDDPPDDR